MPLHSLTSCGRDGGNATHAARLRRPWPPPGAGTAGRSSGPIGTRTLEAVEGPALPTRTPARWALGPLVPPGPRLRSSRAEQDRDALSTEPRAGAGTRCRPGVSGTGRGGLRDAAPSASPAPPLSPQPSHSEAQLPQPLAPAPKTRLEGTHQGPPPLDGRPRGRHCVWHRGTWDRHSGHSWG